MIVAYCDHCGEKIPPNVKSGCRIVMGAAEYSWHLCETDKILLKRLVENFLSAHPWRTVK